MVSSCVIAPDDGKNAGMCVEYNQHDVANFFPNIVTEKSSASALLRQGAWRILRHFITRQIIGVIRRGVQKSFIPVEAR